MKLLLYCTKQPHKLFNTDKGFVLTDFELGDFYKDKTFLNGKIIAECDFEVIKNEDLIFDECFNKETQLTLEQMALYTGVNDYYCIHIKNLHIFDEPRELSKYHRPYGCINISCDRKTKGKYLGCSLVRHCKMTQIKKAPQNMMKVESKICDEKDYVLISIRPEWLCKILNKEKTIEIRKQILKCMRKES